MIATALTYIGALTVLSFVIVAAGVLLAVLESKAQEKATRQPEHDLEAAALRQAAAQDAERQRRRVMFVSGHRWPKGSA